MPDQVSRLLPDRTPAGERQWCSIRCPEGEMFNSKPDRCKTLYQIFQRGLSISMDQPCMGYRPTPDAPYFWLTYSEVAQNADNVSSGLIHRGVKKAEFIGISSHNSHEWSTLSIACDSQVFPWNISFYRVECLLKIQFSIRFFAIFKHFSEWNCYPGSLKQINLLSGFHPVSALRHFRRGRC